MRKNDEAIRYFEDAIKETDEIIADCSPLLQGELTEQKGHFINALSALRKQSTKENGCFYCADGFYRDVLGSPCEYNYCPMCGRELKTGDRLGS